MKRAIEEDFPIVEINRLAVPERNSFKPIYQMHKWFARRALLELYQTAPPWTAEEICGLPDSDVIYTFWTKSAVCTSPTCRKQVPLFSDYVVAGKSPSIRYYPDCKCPKCDAEFDWEVEPAALIADKLLPFYGDLFATAVANKG